MNESKDIHEAFPSNRKLTPVRTNSEKPQEKKKTEKIVSGTVKQQKRSLGKRMAETFLEDNTRSVGDYVIHDVLIPAAKSMICDIVGWGGFAEMLLFGSIRGNQKITRQGGQSRTSYGNFHQSSNMRDRGMTRDSRARHDFGQISLDSRGEAEDVLSHLVDMTIDYGQATVADLYDLVGITSAFTDNKYGWTDLRNSSVSRGRDGYIINLPRAIPLD